MGLMSSMYSGISGLTTHSQAMSVIGNNLANSSTMGFKRSTCQFQDMFYSTITAGNNFGQIGTGVSLASIYGDFSQGPYEATNSATDLAIGGNGFFMVNSPQDGSQYYTRAGNFVFNTNGYLVDPNGYVVQGWAASTNNKTGVTSSTGALGDVKLDSFQCAPSATTSMRLVTNLNAASEDKTTDATDPFFALMKSWDGQSDPSLADTSYSYQSTMKIYDEAGGSHNVTVYFDRASNAAGKDVWEYVVACDPTEDGRTFGGVAANTTSSAGLLMAGTLTFDSTGRLSDMSAFTLSETATGNLKDLSNWVPTEFNDDGYPVFTANFSESSNASAVTSANAINVSMDFGIRSKLSGGGGWSGGVADASLVGTNAANLPGMAQLQTDATTSTSWEKASNTSDQAQDGYSAGYLLGVSVSSDGVVTASYSNSQTKDLFVLGLADFVNLQGLTREGNNLFGKSRDSGEPRIGRAGDAGMGTLASGQLEQSNVDTATEMVDMITTQRGFQASSKVITTVDTMLSEVIQLKR